MKLMRD